MYQASRSLERKTLESAIKFIRKKDIYIIYIRIYIQTNKTQNAHIHRAQIRENSNQFSNTQIRYSI